MPMDCSSYVEDLKECLMCNEDQLLVFYIIPIGGILLQKNDRMSATIGRMSSIHKIHSIDADLLSIFYRKVPSIGNIYRRQPINLYEPCCRSSI